MAPQLGYLLQTRERIGKVRVFVEFWHAHGREQTLPVLGEHQRLDITVLAGDDPNRIDANAY